MYLTSTDPCIQTTTGKFLADVLLKSNPGITTLCQLSVVSKWSNETGQTSKKDNLLIQAVGYSTRAVRRLLAERVGR